MESVPIWSRMCLVRKDLDHIDAFPNAILCPFCNCKNPTPKTNSIVQMPNPSKTKKEHKKPSQPKRRLDTGNQIEPIEIGSSSEDHEDDEPVGLAVSQQFSKLFGDCTVANNARKAQATKDNAQTLRRGPHQDASSAPISQRERTVTAQATQYKNKYKMAVQALVGRFSYDEDDIDRAKQYRWKKIGM